MSVCIYSTVNQIEVGLIQGAFDEQNIVHYVKNLHSNSLGLAGWTTQFAGTNLMTGNIEIYVNETDVEKALNILKSLFSCDENINESDNKKIETNNVTSLKDTENEYIETNTNINKRERAAFTKFCLIFTLVFKIIFLILINMLYLSASHASFNKEFLIHVSLYILLLSPGIIGIILLLKWKKIGFWLFCVESIVFPITILFLNNNDRFSFNMLLFNLAMIIFMSGILRIKKNGLTTWEQLK